MSKTDLVGATIDRGAHRILVVDDHPTTRYSTSRTLRAAGFATEEVGTGTQALQRASEGMSALVLDVHLPDIDGLEVCRLLRSNARTANIPVIHLSATYVDDGHKVQGLNAGADAYLVHPAEPAVLVATLQALIRARSAEDRMRRSESQFRAIYNQVPNGMALLDGKGQFQDVNPALTAVLGYPVDAMRGRAVADFAASGSEQAAQALVDQAATLATAGGPVWHAEFALRGSDGQDVPFAWSLAALGAGELVAATAIDVSAREALARARQEVLEREQSARATAEHHSRTKDDFVAILSHELRTPLNAISGWVHILQKHGASRPDLMGKALDAIARSVAAQSRIIGDILDVSRVNTGKLRLHREWAEPIALARSAIDGLQDDIAARSLQLRVSEGPRADEQACIDATRFQQVVWNLVSNAIKFSQPGGSIEVRLSREGDTLTLEVQDQGKGIHPEFLPHLFSRFTQSDAPDNRMHGGLGLGLSIVKRLVELHGGSAEAFSEGEGRGTTMVVQMNVSGQDALEATTTERIGMPTQGASSISPLSERHVLVVEDSPDAAEKLTLVLQEAGATVQAAASFDAAIVALKGRWPDLVVSDIGLPGRDGYDLIAELRRLERATRPGEHIRCVALTAFTRAKDAERALEAGFDAHLTKPLDAAALLAALTAKQPVRADAATASATHLHSDPGQSATGAVGAPSNQLQSRASPDQM